MPSPIHHRSLTIRQKQAVTLAGAIGILACGACFAPSNYKPPPPPPIQIDLHGIHTITVEVTGTPESSHLDTTALAKRMTEVLNVYRGETGVAVAAPGKPSDATLRISLLGAVAVPVTGDAETKGNKWDIQLRYSAALITSKGTVIWSKTGPSSWTLPEHSIIAADAESFWNSPSLSFPWIYNRFSFHIVRQMYYEAPK